MASDVTSGETYIVQYRSDLASTNPWTTLTNYMPPDAGTNVTIFTHSNVVQNPNCGGQSDVFLAEPAAGRHQPSPFDGLMVMRSGAPGSMTPLCLYPSGFDFTGFLIFDPSSGEWADGTGFVRPAISSAQVASGSESADDDPAPELDGGFYRVTRNGVHIVGLTNGETLSGTLEFQVEFGIDSGTLKEITVSDDGAAFEGASTINVSNSPLTFTLDCTRMTNGPHNLQLIAYVAPTNEPPAEPDGSEVLAVEGTPIPVVVSNDISFPYWEPLYFADWQALYIQARSAHTNADWQVDVYGDDYDYIGSFGGHTDDGLIAVAWNLVDLSGTVRTDAFFIPVITTSWTNDDGDPQAQAIGPNIWRGNDYFPSRGDWVVANQQAWQGYNNADLLDLMADSVAQGNESAGFTVRPAGTGGSAFRLPVTGDFTNAWKTFYNAITNFSSRNLFYFGHGHDSTLGGYANPGNGYGISGTELGDGLRNIPWYDGIFGRQPKPNPQRYRFVFIDGCEGADGGLPFSFGITNNRDPQLHPYEPGEARPCAFMGFKGDVAIGVLNNGIYLYHPNYVSWFFYEWVSNGKGLEDARRDAMNHSGTEGFPLSALKIIGFKDLHYTEADFK